MVHRTGAWRWLRYVLTAATLLATMAGLPRSLASTTKLVSMPPFGDVRSDLAISADGQFIVYRADGDSDGVDELYSVPVGGGAPVKLNRALPGGVQILWGKFEISLDSSRVVYRAEQDAVGTDELYSVPIAGPASAGVKLNGALPGGGSVRGFQISLDSARVVYRADQDVAGVYELYSVPIAGPAGARVQLNPELPSGGDVYDDFQISPDGSRVVYRANQDDVRTVLNAGGVDELYSVPLIGGASVKLNHALRFEVHVCVGEGIFTDDVDSFAVSPDSSRVVYRAKRYEGCDHVYELYSVPIAGPPTTGPINGSLGAGGDVSDQYQISPDSARVVYIADQETDGVNELYSVPIAGPSGAAVKLNGSLVGGGDVSVGFQFSPDSGRVVYLADQETDTVDELYSVPIGGPSSSGIKINALLTSGEVDQYNYRISPDGSWVVYVAGRAFVDWAVYSVPLAGPASAAHEISGPMVSGGSVYTFDTRFRISPDGHYVVYRADQDADEVYELYSVPIAGPTGSSVRVSGTMVAGGSVDINPSYRFCPGGHRVAYIADQDTGGVMELYLTAERYVVFLPLARR